LTETTLVWVQQHPEWLLLGVFFIAFLESLAIAGIVVPGVALLFGLALLAGQSDLPLAAGLSAAITGAIAGDGISFYLGRRYRSVIHSVWPLNRYTDILSRGEAFFKTHGGKSIIIGRFVGPVRPVIPLVAGSLGMNPLHFLAFNVGSALAWGPFYFLPGYLAGSAVDLPTLSIRSPWLLTGSVILSAVGAGLLGAQVHWRLRTLPGHWPRTATLTGITAGCLFTIWSMLHVYGGVGDTLDHNVFLFFNARAGSSQHLFLLLTLLGDPSLLYPVFTLFLFFLWKSGHRRQTLCFIGGGLLLHLSTSLTKAFFAIERPPGTLYPESFAYPSGHASGAIFVYGIIAVIALANLRPQMARMAGMLAGTFIFLVAGSRLYLDVHWFSDVLGGLLLGAALAGLSARAASGYKPLADSTRISDTYLALLAAGWITGALLYVLWQWQLAVDRYLLQAA
jgi:membrane protein DedA with SNARE-associated domain/membrane-associated phospholipid phosphatase